MPPIPGHGARIEMNLTSLTGTFVLVGYVTGHRFPQTRTRPDPRKYYGGARFYPPGTKTGTLALDYDVDPADTAGQVALRAAFQDDLDPPVFIQILPEGTGEAGVKFEARLNSVDEGGDANSEDPQNGSMELEVVYPLVAVAATP